VTIPGSSPNFSKFALIGCDGPPLPQFLRRAVHAVLPHSRTRPFDVGHQRCSATTTRRARLGLATRLPSAPVAMGLALPGTLEAQTFPPLRSSDQTNLSAEHTERTTTMRHQCMSPVS